MAGQLFTIERISVYSSVLHTVWDLQDLS